MKVPAPQATEQAQEMYKRRTALSTMTKKYDKTSGLIAISRHVGRAVRGCPRPQAATIKTVRTGRFRPLAQRLCRALRRIDPSDNRPYERKP